MRKMTLAEAQAALKAQGVHQRDCAVICQICGTVQSMKTLVKAGANPDFVERFFAYSCEGRFSNAGPWPANSDQSAKARARRAVRGCDWTLGGLFTVHTLTIIYPKGDEHPSFEIATPDQAQTLAAASEEMAPT